MKFQYHLTGKGHSGRALRVRALGPSETETNLTSAAMLVGSEATVLQLKKCEWRNGIKMMITEFTDSVAVADLPTAKWKKPGPGQLDDIDSFFTPKDWMALESIYRELHEITPAELEAITGKAVPLSEA